MTGMRDDEKQAQVVTEKSRYEKPTIEEQEEMIFPEEVWQRFSDGQWCFGCSNCNCN